MPENDDQRLSKIEREEWNAEEISEQATNLSPDEIQRQMLRGDETEGDADERDVVGNVNPSETQQGRERNKRE